MKKARSNLKSGWVWIPFWALLAVAFPLQADIYSWVDADGVMHFSNQNAPESAQRMTEHTTSPEEEAEALASRERTRAENLTTELNNKLDEANRKLAEAAEKMDALKAEAERSRIEANAAAQAAQAAAVEAKASAEYRSGAVYAIPYHKKRIPHRQPDYFNHDKSRYPYYQDDRPRQPAPHPRKPSDFAANSDRRPGDTARKGNSKIFLPGQAPQVPSTANGNVR